MRTIKTGIAVMMTVIIGKIILADNLETNLFHGVVGCVVSMQNTVKSSFKAGFGRVMGTVVGGIVGFICVLIRPGDPLLAGLGIMTTIYICNITELQAGIVVSSVVFSSILLGGVHGNPAFYSFIRAASTAIGVIVGLMINYIIVRPNYLESTVHELRKVQILLIKVVEKKIVKKEDINIEKLKKEVFKLDITYNKFLEELRYNKREIDISDLKKAIGLCEKIYSHIQSIELLNKDLYINTNNYDKLKSMFKINKINWDIDDNKSPVFNYHLEKIITEISELKRINNILHINEEVA